MEELDRLKLSVKTLISLGVAKNQEEIGKLMGYTNKSSFSQVLNGLVPIPDKFIEKLCRLDKRLNRSWIVNEFGDILRKKEDSKQVYIKEGIDIDKYDEEREIERQKKYPYNNDFQYKDLAEARLQTVNSQLETIEGLKFKVATLEKELSNLKIESNLSVQKGTVEFLNEPPLEHSRGK